MAIDVDVRDGIAEVVIDNPPVNALDSAGWRDEFAERRQRARRAATTSTAS